MKPDKIYEGRSTIRMFNADCKDFMNECEKNQYELAIVDPPYGIGMDKNPCGRLSKYGDVSKADNNIPNENFFNQIFTISKNQIIWGGNYHRMPPTRCFLLWDKIQPSGVTFASHEYAWTSFNHSAKCFHKRPQNADSIRIHPTQKPVQLYRWLLQNHANEGDTILDTHGGSMSIAIACWEEGFDLDIIELDEDYFNDAVKRFENHIKQGVLF